MKKISLSHNDRMEIFNSVLLELVQQSKTRRSIQDVIDMHEEEAENEMRVLMLDTYKELRGNGMEPFPATLLKEDYYDDENEGYYFDPDC